MSVSVIITVYNRAHLLMKALLSLKHQSLLPDELILSDDGSQEDIPLAIQNIVSELDFPVKFISQKHNGYRLAKCRNNGARHASGDYLIFIDQDIVLNKAFVETFVKHRTQKQFCVSYPVRLTQKQTDLVTDSLIESSNFSRIVSYSQIIKIKKQYLKDNLYRILKKFRLRSIGPKLRGGVAAINRADYETVNGYDENFQGWGNEDDNFGRRLCHAGICGKNPFYDEFPLHLYHEPFHRYGHRVNLAYFHQQLKELKKGVYRCQFGFDNPLDNEEIVVMTLN
ncbi:MAG: glycosyltransferase [bacterium]|nr:glycosyltransferase [bacterium]